jgi:DNA-binding MarR family transcriptional regulator
LQDELNGDLKEIPLKQRRKPALTLLQYQQQSSSRDEAIFLSYQSGGYTLKDIGEHFKLHYSRVSRIIAKGKT